MAKKKATFESLGKEVSQLRADLHAVKRSMAVTKVVTATVEGPRRSEVAVDAQVVPMSGEFTRTGKKSITLTPPTIAVDVVTHGQVGTSGKLTLDIDDKTQTATFVTTTEHQAFPFDFKFEDFGL